MGLLKVRCSVLREIISEVVNSTHNNRQVSGLGADGETDTAANEREEEFRTLVDP